ncbi:MAG TPA: polyprenyl synthetase family protein [Actinophytocola sp.]|uniref:polyprenyl synthetase family protein n=1 Tax=Actinophytocola sp. TaxID=1872138 RepID=UPI002DB63C9D|nr:polyprenyl synthetase family protein [Actinophytocola sp.]HEU5474000.1 polyprenyl synthetase family protein [Actinophytocola sp.]
MRAAVIDDDVPASVEDALARYLAQRRADLVARAPAFADAVDALTGFVLGGGKRIRPTFAWWGWRGAGGAAGGERAAVVLRTISALELLQACALVHDDLMDASAVRRGSPTVHVAFADTHRTKQWLGDPDRFGMAAAVLIGDLALAWAEDMFAGVDGARPPAGAREAWQAMRSEVLAGQFLDVLVQATGDESAGAALAVAQMKTAAYTVERPLHLGAALAGADERTLAAVRRFGADVGVAFQLRDDLLGVFGDTRATGKPAGDDLREGKRTLLVALGLQLAERAGRGADAAMLRAALGDADLAPPAIERIRDVLTGVGAVDAVERRIEALTGSAVTALTEARLAEPAASRLAELAVAASRRDR